jgi:hypothetical protein
MREAYAKIGVAFAGYFRPFRSMDCVVNRARHLNVAGYPTSRLLRRAVLFGSSRRRARR